MVYLIYSVVVYKHVLICYPVIYKSTEMGGVSHIIVFALSIICHSTAGFTVKHENPLAKYKMALEGTRKGFISLPVDHFNPKDKRTWKMMYFEHLDFFKKGGPIFFQMGQEDAASENFFEMGIELANETNGALYQHEHRYYGQSYPLEGTRVENYKYLSSRQALADVATMLKSLKNKPEYKNSKVVVIGGSYSGNLAAWMRKLYPDVVDAAWASSAPVLAKADFHEYLEKVSDDFMKYGGPDCVDKIKKEFKRYDDLLQTDSGIAQIKKELNICDDSDLRIALNKEFLFLSLIGGNYARYSQYGSPKVIKQLCNKIESISKNNLVEQMLFDSNSNCTHVDFVLVKEYIKNDPTAYSWTYQTCTEFGYFQTANTDAQMFTKNIPIEYYYAQCTGVFGSNFNEDTVKHGVETTNRLYGGLNPDVSKIIFTNGGMDPWSKLSILKDISADIPAKVTPDVSHCRDLGHIHSGDPKELRETQLFVKNTIKKWIHLA